MDLNVGTISGLVMVERINQAERTMKLFNVFFLSAALLGAAGVQADEVIKETPDNSVGALYGGLSGVLIGGAAGGPLGALVGAGIGLFAGEGVQQVTGLSQRAYVVKTAQGEQATVRSPNAQFSAGDRVTRQAGRLHASH
jgi:outer membrane lipoprotein SlyB